MQSPFLVFVKLLVNTVKIEENGTLGIVANLHSRHNMLSHKHYLEQL